MNWEAVVDPGGGGGRGGGGLEEGIATLTFGLLCHKLITLYNHILHN